MEKRIERLRASIERAQQEIAAWENEIERLSVFRYDSDKLFEMYWRTSAKADEIKVKLQLDGFNPQALVRHWDTGFNCPECSQPHIIKSRAHCLEVFGRKHLEVMSIKDDPRKLCRECKAKKRSDKRQAAYWREYGHILKPEIKPKTKYQEYLESDHWKQTRAGHLERAGYRCQVCNNGDCILNVHHRTYDRLGQELPEDLIALCSDCHELFHSNRRLAA